MSSKKWLVSQSVEMADFIDRLHIQLDCALEKCIHPPKNPTPQDHLILSPGAMRIIVSVLEDFNGFKREIKDLENGVISPEDLAALVAHKSLIKSIPVLKFRWLEHGSWTAVYELNYAKRLCEGRYVIEPHSGAYKLLRKFLPDDSNV